MKKLLLFSLLVSASISAQNFSSKKTNQQSEQTTYQYKPIITKHKKTSEILPFVNISNEKRGIFRVTNDYGEIEFPYLETHVNDTITFSGIDIETFKVPLKRLKNTVYIDPIFNTLDEVIIAGKRSPKSVLLETIKKIKKNHPTSLHNYKRYSKVTSNDNFKTFFELELLANECNLGYHQDYISTLALDKLHWIIEPKKKHIQYTSQLFAFRENPIQYANILHKRKHKKFEISYVTSDSEKNDEYYIIAFKTDKKNWNYTNKTYPTSYFGTVFIRKKDFSIAKVVEKWETMLTGNEMDLFTNSKKISQKLSSILIKDEKIALFNTKIDGKYYASTFVNKTFKNYHYNSGKKINRNFIVKSRLFDHELENVKEIPFEQYENEKIEIALKNKETQESFWKQFSEY